MWVLLDLLRVLTNTLHVVWLLCVGKEGDTAGQAQGFSDNTSTTEGESKTSEPEEKDADGEMEQPPVAMDTEEEEGSKMTVQADVHVACDLTNNHDSTGNVHGLTGAACVIN